MEVHAFDKTFLETVKNVLALIGAGSVLCTMGIFFFFLVSQIREDLRSPLDSDRPRKRQDD